MTTKQTFNEEIINRHVPDWVRWKNLEMMKKKIKFNYRNLTKGDYYELILMPTFYVKINNSQGRGELFGGSCVSFIWLFINVEICWFEDI